MSPKLILIGGAVLVSAALAGGVLFVTGFLSDDKNPVEQAQDMESKQENGRTEDKKVEQDGHASKQDAPKQGGHASKKAPEQDGPRFVQLNPLTIPVTRKNVVQYFVYFDVKIAVPNKSASKEITYHKVRLRDAFLRDVIEGTPFSNRRDSSEEVEAIKQHFLDLAQDLFDHDMVLDVVVGNTRQRAR